MAVTLKNKTDDAKRVITDALKRHPNACTSFSGGKDSLVLLHLILMVKPDIPVIIVLSDTEFSGTYEYIKKLKADWDFKTEEYSFKNDPDKGIDHCCRENKVEKFKEALAKYDMWFSGIRRDEGFSRINFDYEEERDGLVKINPLLDLTERDIWRYIAVHGLKVNPVYGEGYRSLSCKHCSEPEQDEKETERAGRWVGAKCEGEECGIHTQSLR